MATLDSDWLRHFGLLFKNHCRDNHQTCHKCSFYCPAEVSLLFVSINNPRLLPWTVIGWDILDYFLKTTAWTVAKLAKNVPFMVPKKCCYFSLISEIQDGCDGLWLAETVFDFFSRTTVWTITKFASNVPLVALMEEVLSLFVEIKNSKMVAVDSDWLRHFRLLFKNHSVDDHQTYHNCSSSSPEEVLLLFVAIGNPRWLPWTLIGWDFFGFSRTTALPVAKFTTSVS